MWEYCMVLYVLQKHVHYICIMCTGQTLAWMMSGCMYSTTNNTAQTLVQTIQVSVAYVHVRTSLNVWLC